MKKTFMTLLSILTLVAPVFGQGTIVLWDESIHGTISNDPWSPTSLGMVQSGTNILTGSAEFVPIGGGPGGTLYSDFVTFTVNGGDQISGIWLQTDTPIAVWIGDTGFTSELASVMLPSNGNLLVQLGLDGIQPGNYGFYISNRQFGSEPTIANYHLDFFVQPVPEPSALSLLVLGAGLIGFSSWKKSRMNRN